MSAKVGHNETVFVKEYVFTNADNHVLQLGNASDPEL